MAPGRILLLVLLPLSLWAAWRMAPLFGPGAFLPLTVPLLAWAALRTAGAVRPARLLAGHLVGLLVVTLSLQGAGYLHLPLRLQLVALVLALPLLLLAMAGGRKLRPSALLLHWLTWQAFYWSAWGALLSPEGMT